VNAFGYRVGALRICQARGGKDLTDSFCVMLNGIIQSLDVELNDRTWTMITSFENAV
jgi:hypothetical protein